MNDRDPAVETRPDTAGPPSSPGRVDTFGLALPPEWVRFPVERSGSVAFDAFVREQRRRLAADGGLALTAQRQFELTMRQLRDDCRRRDVTLAALLVQPLGSDHRPVADPMPADVASLLAATCTISVLTRGVVARSQPAVGAELPLTVHTLAAALSRTSADATVEPGVEVVDLEPPAVVTLPAGMAVRLARLHTYPRQPRATERMAIFVRHVLVPYDDGDRAAVITFATPNTELARPLGELFDEIALTFRLFGGDAPTDPHAT